MRTRGSARIRREVLRRRIAAMHLAPMVRRQQLLWLMAIVLTSTMFIAGRYGHWRLAGICWGVLALLFAYALNYLRRLR
jgi:hypothetical protein